MIIDKKNMVLFIHPTHPASPIPVNDKLTQAVDAALKNPLATGCAFKSGAFCKDLSTLGVHTCTAPGCSDVKSHSRDYEIAPGVYTNSLATHYLRFHRDEVPLKDIALLTQVFV